MASSSKKRRTGPSTSASRGNGQYDDTRFTSAENQKWFEDRKNKSIIKEKNVAPQVEAYFHLNGHLAKLGWEVVLHLPE